MPSFDVVSEMDMHEVRNAVDQAARELGTRFDFRGVDAKIELEEESILLTAPEEFQIGQLKDILRGKMASRNVDSRALVPGDVEGAGKVKRQRFTMAQGLDKDNARLVTKVLKDSKLKIQTQMQDNQLRVSGKSRNVLQEAIQKIKDSKQKFPLQFENFRD